MIPAELSKRAKAAPGRVLVVRDEVSAKFLSLYLPPAYQAHTRKAHATILDLHPGLEWTGLKVGDRVLLAPASGRKVVFGFTVEDEVELWSVPIEAVRAILHDKMDLEYAQQPPGDAPGWIASHGPEVDEKFEDGDRRGLR